MSGFYYPPIDHAAEAAKANERALRRLTIIANHRVELELAQNRIAILTTRSKQLLQAGLEMAAELDAARNRIAELEATLAGTDNPEPFPTTVAFAVHDA